MTSALRLRLVLGIRIKVRIWIRIEVRIMVLGLAITSSLTHIVFDLDIIPYALALVLTSMLILSDPQPYD